MQKSVAAILITLMLAVVALLGTLVYQNLRQAKAPDLGDTQAVLLTTGQLFFGRLENPNSAHPVLRDVFYIQSVTDPATKQVNNVLVKRGKELHAPETMVLNASTIAYIESVGADSQVAKLIAEQKGK